MSIVSRSVRHLAPLVVGALFALSALSVSAQTISIDPDPSPSVPLNVAPPRPTNPISSVLRLDGYAIVDTDNLFMRSGDSAEYTPVAILDGGTRLIVLGQNDGFQLWWFVEVGGLRGWVSSEFLILRGDLSDIPVIAVDGEISRPVLYVGVNNPVYTRPGGAFVCNITGDRFYYITGVDVPATTWIQIESGCGAGGATAWISADSGIVRNTGDVFIPVVPY